MRIPEFKGEAVVADKTPELKRVSRYEYVYPQKVFEGNPGETLLMGGFWGEESLEELAQSAPRAAIGIRTFHFYAMEVNVNGSNILLTSDPIERAGISYIDGQLIVIPASESLPGIRIVRTRDGSVADFTPLDRIVSSQKNP